MTTVDASERLVSYLARLNGAFAQVNGAAVGRLAALLEEVRRNRRTVFLAGNGGSAATAAHWANDLNKATQFDGVPAMRVVNLTDNVPWLTALANDEGYERIFAAQVDNLAVAGDLLVVVSASGSSPNLLQAVALAKLRGLQTAALLGFDGGALLSLVDATVLVPTDVGAYGLAETCHSILCDVITECLIASAPTAAGATES